MRTRISHATAAVVQCPRCGHDVPLTPPETVRGTRIREVYCSKCHRRAMIAEASTRILVIDDEQVVRDTLGGVLERAGHEVVLAADGEAGLKAFRANPADVVVLDVYMPGMSGIDLLRKLKREFPAAKVIAMAGQRRHGAPDPLATAKRFGAEQILRKPFPPTTVLQAVSEVLGSAGRGHPG